MKWFSRMAFWRKRPDIEAIWRKAEEEYLRVDREHAKLLALKAELATTMAALSPRS